MCTPIKLKFGTLKGLIKVNLSTKFGGNPMNNLGVLTDNKIELLSRTQGKPLEGLS